ncbi:hypothetical protein C9374_011564 [Naegleria lovaniensis]|uniref:Beta-lactamase-related domain-containing protein n=1 Tax=Naegleria lovaniensis TaxID=51637 RepID=A0AA88H383_NAELO|nr:uncharacterized protein C9374_011564 [Naegleria lovaniensis]KAG2392839.1 hypothetical protein C9374_011564 [Naegleria lovaniensis]
MSPSCEPVVLATTQKKHGSHSHVKGMNKLLLKFLMIVACCVLQIVIIPCTTTHALTLEDRFALSLASIQAIHDKFFQGTKGSASTAIIFRNETLGEIFAGQAFENVPNVKPTRDTKYRIASVTKTFVSAAMMVLRDEGRLDLDQSVLDFVPEFKAFPNPLGFSSNMTFRQLSSYMSGLPREAPCVLFDCDFSNAQMIDRIKKNGLFLVRDGDHFPIYSNLGYSLLGHGLESAAAMQFEQVIATRILDRLGMKNTGFVTKDNLNTLQLATGYHHNTPIYSNNRTISWNQPAAGMYSSLGDLQLYVKNLLAAFVQSADTFPQTSILKKQTMREFLSAQHILSHGTAAVGLSWEMVFYNMFSSWAIMKSGLIGGYNAQIVLLPKYEMAVITLLSKDDGAQALALQSAMTIVASVSDYLDSLRMKDLSEKTSSLVPNVVPFVGNYKTEKQSAASIALHNTSTTQVLKLKNVLGTELSSTFLMPTPSNGASSFIVQAHAVPTRLQYETGIGGSRIEFSQDFQNFTALDLGVQFMNKSSGSNVARRPVSLRSTQNIPVVCNFIPKDVALKTPIADSSILNLFEQLKQEISALMKQQNSSAFLKITYRGQAVYDAAFGDSSISQHSIFRIGTLTQLFTAAATLIAKEKGIISSLDDPVNRYVSGITFQEVISNSNMFSNNMTFRQLMQHASGLPSGIPCDLLNCNMNWNTYLQEALSKFRMIQPSYNSRTVSTLGYAILGNVLSQVTGTSLENFIKTNILNPLGMSNTGFTYTTSVKNQLVLGRDLKGQLLSSEVDNLYIQEASAQMYSTASDMSIFLNCLSSLNRECPILKRERSRSLLLRNYLSDDFSMSTGLGSWQHEFNAGFWIASKYGTIKGYNSYAGVNDEIDLAITLLTSTEYPVANELVRNKTLIPQLVSTFTSVLKQQPSYLMANLSIPNSLALIQDMVGVYQVFDQFLLFTQYLQIEYDTTNGLLTFAFVENATPGPSNSPPTFALQMMDQTSMTFKVTTLGSLSCMGNVLTGIEGAVVKFNMANGKVESFSMPSLNYGSDFIKIKARPSTSRTISGAFVHRGMSCASLLLVLVLVIGMILHVTN